MTKIHHISLFLTSMALLGCTEDFGKTSVTYEKATAIYGDLESMRNQSVFVESRDIIDPGKIFVGDRFILIGEEGVGIHILDNANPEAPAEIGFIQVFGNREYFLDGANLFAESVYDMVKIDLSDFRQPHLIGRIEDVFATPQYNEQGEAIIGFSFEQITEEYNINDPELTWLGEGDTHYFDFTNQLIPPSAVPTSFAGNSNQNQGTVNRITSYQEHVYVISRSEISIFSGQGSFDFLARHSIGWDMETIYPLDDRLFIGTRNSMEVYDISNPVDPVWDGAYFHETSCDPVLPVENNTAYVTLRTGDIGGCPGTVNELVVLDVSSRWDTQEIQSFQMHSPYGMSLVGDRLYVGEGANGLAIFDASERRNLQLIERNQQVDAYDIIPHPSRQDFILIAGPEGFSQYQIGSEGTFFLISTIAF